MERCSHWSENTDGFPPGIPRTSKEEQLFEELNDILCGCQTGGFTAIKKALRFREVNRIGHKQFVLFLGASTEIHSHLDGSIVHARSSSDQSLVTKMKGMFVKEHTKGGVKTINPVVKQETALGNQGESDKRAVSPQVSELSSDGALYESFEGLKKSWKGSLSYPLIPTMWEGKWQLFKLPKEFVAAQEQLSDPEPGSISSKKN
jgi:hypothetical protein